MDFIGQASLNSVLGWGAALYPSRVGSGLLQERIQIRVSMQKRGDLGQQQRSRSAIVQYESQHAESIDDMAPALSHVDGAIFR